MKTTYLQVEHFGKLRETIAKIKVAARALKDLQESVVFNGQLMSESTSFGTLDEAIRGLQSVLARL